ncbi:hypothetical protein QTI66_00120 [Variovorax sp. J22R133]|uniref:hypothetical protein n=1 Tax=Variovorax brevis TaxID=3053503 RepID=UPI002576F410|nr:hypothetical protein [Variovorax sp. J22R133]MDM0110534.1 hypothetical protein [Variovorax sp. J22R133]
MATFARVVALSLLSLIVASSAFSQAPTLGTYVPKSQSSPRLAVYQQDGGKWGAATSICEQCLAGGPSIPKVCLMMLCMRTPLEQQKILVPPTAKEMIEQSCKLNRFCVKDNFEILSTWPPKPGDPGPYDKTYRNDQITKPYKGFLEMSRVDADRQLKAGALSKADYDSIIDDYRKDWKSLQLDHAR